jgi:hypothetical protein
MSNTHGVGIVDHFGASQNMNTLVTNMRVRKSSGIAQVG